MTETLDRLLDGTPFDQLAAEHRPRCPFPAGPIAGGAIVLVDR